MKFSRREIRAAQGAPPGNYSKLLKIYYYYKERKREGKPVSVPTAASIAPKIGTLHPLQETKQTAKSKIDSFRFEKVMIKMSLPKGKSLKKLHHF